MRLAAAAGGPYPAIMKARVRIDDGAVAAFAGFFKASDEIVPFDFCSRSEGFIYPDRGQPGVMEYFFFVCAHQFGFWRLENDRWTAPMVARIDGRDLKGSDYLFRAATRAWQRDPMVFAPDPLQRLEDSRIEALFLDDHGRNPLPLWPEHLAIIRASTQWFAHRRTRPDQLLQTAQSAPKPLQALLELLAEVPGYAEDPLAKKAMLLAITLENRPEKFLSVPDPESAKPIIDYHLQRSALRTGLVRVDDEELRERLQSRRRVEPREEELIRAATYEAIERLMQQTGLSAAAIDWFFFQNRSRCPETTQPDCAVCPVRAICARQTRLFQPVFRTTAY